jgi:hypothetical protein
MIFVVHSSMGELMKKSFTTILQKQYGKTDFEKEEEYAFQ